LKHFDIEFAAI